MSNHFDIEIIFQIQPGGIGGEGDGIELPGEAQTGAIGEGKSEFIGLRFEQARLPCLLFVQWDQRGFRILKPLREIGRVLLLSFEISDDFGIVDGRNRNHILFKRISHASGAGLVL